MLILLVYLFIISAAAFAVKFLFGESQAKELPPGRGLDFFSQYRTKGKELLFSSDWAKKRVPQDHQRSILSLLEQNCCLVPAQAKHITVLNEPCEFYETLKTLVLQSDRKVMMSALYIGDGPLSRGLIDCIEEKVKEKIAQKKPFQVDIILDYNRMHDRKNLLTVRKLLELDYEYNKGLDDGEEALVSVRVHLFQNPCQWNRLFTPLGRAKEVFGVQHTKLFVFDDKHNILTGANLSDDYFATRMDRYIVIKENSYLADWCTGLMNVLIRVSHPVVCVDWYQDHSKQEGSPSFNAALVEEPQGLWQKVAVAFTPHQSASPVSSPTRHRRSNCVILPNASPHCPSEETKAFAAFCETLLLEFSKEQSERLSGVAEVFEKDGTEGDYDTVLFPTLQFARAGVLHDSAVVKRILNSLNEDDHLYLTSPYLNMYSDFVEEVLYPYSDEATCKDGAVSKDEEKKTTKKKNCYFDVITASTATNGWQGHKGMAGYIPYFYLQLERSFFYLMKAYGALHRVRVREFSREGHTFHAKGLWVMDRGERKDESLVPPYLVAYGSTNYGYRSVHKDVEAEAFLFTWNETLRASLREELQLLCKDSLLVDENRFVGKQGRFQPVISLVAQLGQSYL